MPEFELWETANKRTKLLILLGREGSGRIAVFEAFILGERGVELGLEEEKEEV
jgi:hypothetical protein